jgi:hypothetical protein
MSGCSFLVQKDLTESYVQMYEIFIQRSGFQREDLKNTISLVSLKVRLVLGHGSFLDLSNRIHQIQQVTPGTRGEPLAYVTKFYHPPILLLLEDW